MTRLLASWVAVLVMFAPSAGATPGDPYAPQYYFDTWQVAKLWASGARGQGITIAEIDTGVDASVAVLDGRVLVGKDFGRFGGDGRIDRDEDPFGHGTSMASIMVGRPGQFGIRGLAPDATLLPVAVPLAGTTDASTDDKLPAAIRWAADHGAKIISMSLGATRNAAQNQLACPTGEQDAIYHALRKGAVLLAASGNRGRENSPVDEPSVCLGVVSVGAVDRDGAVADFSSRHRYLTLTSPGVNIASIGLNGAPFAGDGTSQAVAIASAAAALVWSKFPRLSASQLVGRLLATLDRRSATRDPAYGYGINPQRALTTSVPINAPDPVYALAQPFVARAGAPPNELSVPKPIALADHPPGRYKVGAAPRLLASRVIGGIAVAAGGLLLLIALIVTGGMRRRRSRASSPDDGSGLDGCDVLSPETHRIRPE